MFLCRWTPQQHYMALRRRGPVNCTAQQSYGASGCISFHSQRRRYMVKLIDLGQSIDYNDHIADSQLSHSNRSQTKCIRAHQRELLLRVCTFFFFIVAYFYFP